MHDSTTANAGGSAIRVRTWAALLALNAGLVGLLALRATGQDAAAQGVGPPRARGEYTMLSGRLNAGGNQAVYVLDATNQDVVALRWDQTKEAMIGIGYRSLNADAQAQPGR